MNRILVFALLVLCSSCDKIEAPYGKGNPLPVADCFGSGPIVELKFKATPLIVPIDTVFTITLNAVASNGCIDTTFNGSLTFTRKFLPYDTVEDSISGQALKGVFNAGNFAFDKSGKYALKIKSDSLNLEQEIFITVFQRKVLIEDFTGHTCQACPNAHREATRLHTLFGDQVVVVAVHADFWANPYPAGAPYYTYDFRTPLATQIATDFGVIGQPFPKGMINRMNNPATGQPWVLDWGAWEDRISDWLSQPADAKISITPAYNPASRAVTADVDVLAVNDIPDACQLAIYFVEDSIINWQKDQTASPSDVQNYEHNHVLRGSLNGTYGENLGVLSAGTSINRNYTGTLTPADAVADRVKLIAVLSNAVTREIIQVEEVDLVE